MHLSPAALDAAIRLLDEPSPAKAGHCERNDDARFGRGEILDAAGNLVECEDRQATVGLPTGALN
jgi:hypothetical protein